MEQVNFDGLLKNMPQAGREENVMNFTTVSQNETINLVHSKIFISQHHHCDQELYICLSDDLVAHYS